MKAAVEHAGPTDNAAIARARRIADKALGVLEEYINAEPDTQGRGAQWRLTAAIKVLEIAGVSFQVREQLKLELLEHLRKALPAEVYGTVVRALGAGAELPGERDRHDG